MGIKMTQPTNLQAHFKTAQTDTRLKFLIEFGVADNLVL